MTETQAHIEETEKIFLPQLKVQNLTAAGGVHSFVEDFTAPGGVSCQVG